MDSKGGDPSHQHTDSGTAVEFVYRPTAADFEEALHARARRSPSGRAQALMAPLVALIAVSIFSVLQDAPLPVWIISLVLAGSYSTPCRSTRAATARPTDAGVELGALAKACRAYSAV
ncbi:hypothetical protein JIX55_39470 [Streptomyces sp. DSM 40750]|nr:hypothetical protein [Streptomyces sp. DSM 40750]UUU28427.1 hypothetical protein JIX55_39470 [Streptomyces sp. DSM 40750]